VPGGRGCPAVPGALPRNHYRCISSWQSACSLRGVIHHETQHAAPQLWTELWAAMHRFVQTRCRRQTLSILLQQAHVHQQVLTLWHSQKSQLVSMLAGEPGETLWGCEQGGRAGFWCRVVAQPAVTGCVCRVAGELAARPCKDTPDVLDRAAPGPGSVRVRLLDALDGLDGRVLMAMVNIQTKP
jgi:hypothetical protein